MLVHLAGAVSAHGTVLDAAGRYVHWGVIQISVTNLLIIVGMIVLFVAALLIPFPGAKADQADQQVPDNAGDPR